MYFLIFSFKIDSITLDPNSNWTKILDPDPNSMNLDPQYCFSHCSGSDTTIHETVPLKLEETLVFTISLLFFSLDLSHEAGKPESDNLVLHGLQLERVVQDCRCCCCWWRWCRCHMAALLLLFRIT